MTSKCTAARWGLQLHNAHTLEWNLQNGPMLAADEDGMNYLKVKIFFELQPVSFASDPGSTVLLQPTRKRHNILRLQLLPMSATMPIEDAGPSQVVCSTQ